MQGGAVVSWGRMFNPSVIVAFVVAAAACALYTPLVRRLAIHVGAMDHPEERKIHREPIPRLGGVAVLAALLTAAIVASINDTTFGVAGSESQYLVIALATLFVMALGVVDDIHEVAARHKFLIESAAAIAVVLWAIPIHSIDLVVVTIPAHWYPLPQIVAAFWIVLVVNAFNMIDGLDGLAAGIGAIAAAALAFASGASAGPVAMVLLASAAGGLTGFLLHNGRPARIFMGDSGTLGVGFVLGCLSLMAFTSGYSWNAFPPILALAVPLLDLVVAVLRRGLKGVQLVQMSADTERYSFEWQGIPGFFSPDARHIHHRLLFLGLSERNAVLALYFAGSVVGLLAVASVQWRQLAPYLLLLTSGAFAYIVSRWFYEELWIFRRGMLLPFFESPLARSRPLHIAFDMTALAVSWILAAVIIGQVNDKVVEHAILAAAVTAAVFWTAKVYAASLRYAGVWELLGLARALLYGVIAAAVLDSMVFHSGFNLGAWVLYGYLGLTITVGARLSFRILDAAYQRGREEGERVMIVGAERGGSVALRELLMNPAAGLKPVGFVDDDRRLWGRRIEGYYVHNGGCDALEALLRSTDARVVVLSTQQLSEERLRVVYGACNRVGAAVMQFRVVMEPVAMTEDVSTPMLHAVNSGVHDARPLIRLK